VFKKYLVSLSKFMPINLTIAKDREVLRETVNCIEFNIRNIYRLILFKSWCTSEGVYKNLFFFLTHIFSKKGTLREDGDKWSIALDLVLKTPEGSCIFRVGAHQREYV